MPQSGGRLRSSVQTAKLCKRRSHRGPKAFEHVTSCPNTTRTYPTTQQCGPLRRVKGVHGSFCSSLCMAWEVPFLFCTARKQPAASKVAGRKMRGWPDVGDPTLVPCRARRVREVSTVGRPCKGSGEYNAMNRAEPADGITT